MRQTLPTEQSPDAPGAARSDADELRSTAGASVMTGRVPTGPNGRADLSSHDDFYELHGIDLTSDAE